MNARIATDLLVDVALSAAEKKKTVTPEELRREADRLERNIESARVSKEIKEFSAIQARAKGAELPDRLDAIRDASLMAPYVATRTLSESISSWVALEANRIAEELDGVERPW
jgi:hypothetical protein